MVDERWLPPGSYELTVRLGERTWSQKVQVDDLTGEPQIIRLACDG